MSDIILKAEGLRKTYDDPVAPSEVLKGIDLEVREGEFVAVVGESGSGKSTLLYMLAGIDKPTAGRVELLGRDTSEIAAGKCLSSISSTISCLTSPLTKT